MKAARLIAVAVDENPELAGRARQVKDRARELCGEPIHHAQCRTANGVVPKTSGAGRPSVGEQFPECLCGGCSWFCGPDRQRADVDLDPSNGCPSPDRTGKAAGRAQGARRRRDRDARPAGKDLGDAGGEPSCAIDWPYPQQELSSCRQSNTEF